HDLSLVFYSDPPPPRIYPLSLHDALPISDGRHRLSSASILGLDARCPRPDRLRAEGCPRKSASWSVSAPRLEKPEKHHLFVQSRSEEHTSELQSLAYLVCRLLLEKKKTI